jgi:hypothetical protein
MKYYKLEIKQDASKEVKEEITKEEAIRLVGLVYNNPNETIDSLSADGVSYLRTPFALIYKQE